MSQVVDMVKKQQQISYWFQKFIFYYFFNAQHSSAADILYNSKKS